MACNSHNLPTGALRQERAFLMPDAAGLPGCVIALVSPQIPRAAGPLIRPAPFRNIPGSPVAGTREPVILFLTEEAAYIRLHPALSPCRELQSGVWAA